jgi:site-specific DNA-cytosine methylase
MKVLVACEYSGVVRDAFEDAGCDAWSCDILPTESEQTKAAGKHLHGDCKLWLYNPKRNEDLAGKILPGKWDLLIGHPPCTFLSFAYTGKERYTPERLQKKIEAYQFFLDLWNAPIDHICIENPMGYVHTGLLPYTQIVEPYYFGHNYKKRTCLWLKNLPKLTYSLTDTLFEKKTAAEPVKMFMDNMNKKKRHGREYVLRPFSSPKERSKFHTGIARAMAVQWTEHIGQLTINS